MVSRIEPNFQNLYVSIHATYVTNFIEQLIWFNRYSIENFEVQRLKIAKIEIRTPLKSNIYFRLVFTTKGVKRTIFQSPIQDLLKIDRELHCRRSTTDYVHKHTDKVIRASIECTFKTEGMANWGH